MIPGGNVSMALASDSIVDTKIRIGPPIGVLTLSKPLPERDLLFVASSAKVPAPLKAIIDQLTTLPEPPKVHLFFGARTPDGLYDLDHLEKIAVQNPWLTVIPSVSGDLRYSGETGSMPDVIARQGDFSKHEAYVVGPSEMVDDTAAPGDRVVDHL